MARSYLAAAAVASLVSLALLSSAASSVLADELPDDQMAPFQFSGMINADNVYVRSYSSENDYPVARLSKGESVVVVGNRFDYLKILPPPGTYCLVGKAWVEVRGDGSVGRVREEANNANVRIGSNLVPAYGKVVTQVRAGEDVKILGQQEEYFKIAPPAGAFVYVHKRFVDLVKRVEVVTENNVMLVKQPAGNGNEATANVTPQRPDGTATPTPSNATGSSAGTSSAGGPQLVPVPSMPSPTPDATPGVSPDATANAAAPTTGPAAGPAVDSSVAAVDPAATQPTAKVDAASFDALEVKFKAATKLPLGEQPIDELAAGYRAVTADKTLPESMLRLAEYRLAGLNLRRDAAETLKEADASRRQREAAQLPLVAEANEITQRMAANEFKRYTAVGTLRTSALPHNGKTLYRLTDPATSRTVIYVADSGANLSQFDGQFVGVRGTVADDSARQIKLLTPQAVEPVDPAELSRGTVSSGMVPPSLSTPSAAAQP